MSYNPTRNKHIVTRLVWSSRKGIRKIIIHIDTHMIIAWYVKHLCKYWCVNSPLVMAPTNREGSNPRLFIFSIVVDARREELLIITIRAPLLASFFTVTQTENRKQFFYHSLERKRVTNKLMKYLSQTSKANW